MKLSELIRKLEFERSEFPDDPDVLIESSYGEYSPNGISTISHNEIVGSLVLRSDDEHGL